MDRRVKVFGAVGQFFGKSIETYSVTRRRGERRRRVTKYLNVFLELDLPACQWAR